MAPYHVTLQYESCDAPYRAIPFQGEVVALPPKWCDTPPCYLASQTHIRAIPRFATYCAIIVRYPPKNKHNRVLRHYRYPVLLFLGLFENQRKLSKTSRISLTLRTLKIPVRLAENTPKYQGNPQQEKHQGNRNIKEKKAIATGIARYEFKSIAAGPLRGMGVFLSGSLALRARILKDNAFNLA